MTRMPIKTKVEAKSLLIWGGMFLAALVYIFQSGVASGRDASASVIAHEKDLVNDPKVGIALFKWSSDSRRIAYAKWPGGEVGIADVETGNISSIPNLQMNAIWSIAWSSDSRLLAVSTGQELKIVRMDDFRIVNDISGHRRFDSKIRIGHVTAFSRDSTRLLFQSPNDYGHVILYAYDLGKNTIEPILRSPFGTRKATPEYDGARFQWHNGRLYFATSIMRDDEHVSQKHVIGQADYGRPLQPITCFVFDLGEGLALSATRSMEFPPPGKEETDGSKDIVDCRYSAANDYLVALRRFPLKFVGESPPFPKSEGFFFEGLGLGVSAASIIFPKGESVEQRVFSLDYELHPSKTWVLTTAYPTGQSWFLTVWDFMAGVALTRVKLTDYLSNSAIAPDGSRAAFTTKSGGKISIYKFNVQ